MKRTFNMVPYIDESMAANYVMGTFDTPWTDKTAARTAVQFERKLELSGEGPQP